MGLETKLPKSPCCQTPCRLMTNLSTSLRLLQWPTDRSTSLVQTVEQLTASVFSEQQLDDLPVDLSIFHLLRFNDDDKGTKLKNLYLDLNAIKSTMISSSSPSPQNFLWGLTFTNTKQFLWKLELAQRNEFCQHVSWIIFFTFFLTPTSLSSRITFSLTLIFWLFHHTCGPT